ncbi:RHS repeat-associated core domain-containing protein [Lentzea kentuckyensis]|uniref:RHS repeat-associated core domain-containing protein n=1 Tax=Lentzea kentuckyensis TaxID=360086 RepID=UPI000A38DF49|nr:RHS repeat-associated core domain-containing protein [Lentzea kentuckyensis]
MGDGDLVAQPKDDTSAVTGIGLLESASDLSEGISNGDWLSAGLGAVGVGLEVLSIVVDPIGTLASYGVSWLIEHVQPLKEALDWLAGNPPVIRAFSETWGRVAAAVAAIAQEFTAETAAGTAGWTGSAADAYRGHAAEVADGIASAGTLADGISAGVMIMGEVVAFVRETVRDIVAELIGRLIAWALEAACTLGAATPVIVGQAVAAISRVVKKIGDLIRRLVKTISNVAPRIRKVIDKLDEIIAKLAKLGRRPSGPDTPNAPDPVHSGTTKPSGVDDGTSPSAARSGGDTTPSSAKTPSTSESPDGTTSPSSANHTPDGDGGPTVTKPGARSESGKPDSLRTMVSNAKGNIRDFAVQAKQKIGRALGDPVDMVSGEVLLAQEDVHLPGVLALVLARTHMSNYRSGRRFGPSWTSTLDMRVEVDAKGVLFASEDGMLLSYPRGVNGVASLPEAGPRWLLTPADRGGYIISDPITGRFLRFAAIRPGDTVLPLAEVTDRNGNSITFLHDDTGALRAIRHSGGYLVRVDCEGDRVTALHLVGAALDGSEVTLKRYTYDDAGNLAEVYNSSNMPMRFAYDSAHRMTRWEDRRGTWYEFIYDDAARCVRGVGADGMLNSTFAYDTAGRVTRHTNSLGHTNTFHYNDLGQVLRRVDPLGGTTRFEYDRYDRLLAETDPLGGTTRWVLDESGDPVETISPAGSRTTARYNDLHLPVAVTEPHGAVWRRDYDERGNLVSTTDPAGASATFEHNELGHLVAATDALGHTRRFETNAAGLRISATNELGATTTYAYDGFGRVTAITDPMGAVARFGWTVEGRPAWRSWPDGTVERRTYDAEGDTLEHVDPAGGVTRTEFTHFDLKAAHTTPDGARLEYVHDTELRLVAVRDPEGLTWTFDYDEAGRVVRETDFNGRVLSYRHDARGNVVERVNGDGQVTTYLRDARGEVVEQRADGRVTTFSYDDLGRVVRATTPDADVEVAYNVVGRLVAETCDGRAVAWTYDRAGRRTSRRTPSGAESVLHYDLTGRIAELATAGRVVTFEHDAAGREVRQRFGAATLTRTWDEGHRLRTSVLAAATPDGSRITQRKAHTYRADGALTAVVDQLSGPRTYDLDPAGRVVRVTGGAEERYTYNASGNVVASSGGAPETEGPWTYQGTRLVRAGATHLDHDAQGRVVRRRRRTLSGRVLEWRYEWDAEDLLRVVTTPDGTRWRYSYDAFQRRVAKERLSADGVAQWRTTFAWDDLRLAEETTSDDHTTTWTWHPEDWRPVTQVDRTPHGTRFHVVLTDLVGTPTELATPDGEITWRGRGPLWGVLGGDGAAYTPLRFPGQYHDRESGLNYNLHRYYDPALSRYLSADPLGLLGGTSVHSYVVNPLTWIDPLGLHGYDDTYKTFAWTDRVNTLSGWGRHPSYVQRPSFSQMRAFHAQVQHPLAVGPDGRDRGVFGRYYAMHAERQAAFLDPNARITVANTMCDDCQKFFQKLAKYRKQTQYVTDPDHHWTFPPDGPPHATPLH